MMDSTNCPALCSALASFGCQSTADTSAQPSNDGHPRRPHKHARRNADRSVGYSEEKYRVVDSRTKSSPCSINGCTVIARHIDSPVVRDARHTPTPAASTKANGSAGGSRICSNISSPADRTGGEPKSKIAISCKRSATTPTHTPPTITPHFSSTPPSLTWKRRSIWSPAGC